MACRIVSKVCKTAGESKLWGFDYARDPETGALAFLARGWRPGQVYAQDAVVLPNLKWAGLEFKGSGGQSGTKEPQWPTVDGATVVDGSITWTAQELSNDSLTAYIEYSDWEADPALTITDEQLISSGGVQRTTVIVSGGAAGKKYEVRNIVTLSNGAVEESALLVEVS